ncbi:hypothetical protein [Inediibacterium massiliense]|uniref:hypothetical protein n=1 Tax=Inediibacterium massiliense TaxID=1658111 RepID=UPI0006B68525|nr:hypothetical protein [Inediibacterium massiliense]
MNKQECIEWIKSYFEIESLISSLKNPDFHMKSHIFYFRDIFHSIDELKILRIYSKNKKDNIVLEVHHISDHLEGLFNGYFRVEPITDSAKKIFKNMSRVCTDLEYFFYHAYHHSEILKKYIVSGDIEYIIEEDHDEKHFEMVRKNTYLELSQYEQKQMNQMILSREKLKKYITHFIHWNKKCSEEVKIFLVNLWTTFYKDCICPINNVNSLEYSIKVDTETILFQKNKELSVYELLEYAHTHQFIVFLYLQFDFEGGD